MNIEDIARRIVADFDARSPGASVTRAELASLSLDEAYRVQQACARLREAHGDGLIGYKVGSKSAEARQRLGTTAPVLGRLFDCDTWDSGARISASRFTELAIEGELAVQLRRDFDSHREAAAHAIDSVFVVIELHNRIKGGRFRGSELVANNAIHAGFVRGATRCPWRAGDGELIIRVDDEVVAEVHGEVLTETIVDSLNWLQEELPRHGFSLQAGQTVLCGTVAPLLAVPPVCRVQVDTDRFGSVNCATVPPVTDEST